MLFIPKVTAASTAPVRECVGPAVERTSKARTKHDIAGGGRDKDNQNYKTQFLYII